MYLRFGNIPEGEKSKIWHIDECVGELSGVSVYDAVIGNLARVAPEGRVGDKVKLIILKEDE